MSLHPQIAALLEAPAGDSFAHVAEDGVVLARLREDYARVTERLGGEPQPVAHVEDLAVPRADGSSIPARAYRPEGDARGAIVWAHGGGWVVGDLDGIDTVCRSLAAAAGAWVLSVDYRLAPEHPFPAAVEDVSRVVGWARGPGARGLGWDERRVVVGGDSAGGNLAAVAARHARDDDAPAPCGQLLVYPATDARRAGESYRRCAAGPMLTAADMQRCWETYLGGDDGESPDASPLRAGELAGVAPAMVLVAAVDPLCDDGVAYAQALRAAGVACELRVYDDMTHGFLRLGGVVDRTREAIGELGAFARERIAGG